MRRSPAFAEIYSKSAPFFSTTCQNSLAHPGGNQIPPCYPELEGGIHGSATFCAPGSPGPQDSPSLHLPLGKLGDAWPGNPPPGPSPNPGSSPQTLENRSLTPGKKIMTHCPLLRHQHEFSTNLRCRRAKTPSRPLLSSFFDIFDTISYIRHKLSGINWEDPVTRIEG